MLPLRARVNLEAMAMKGNPHSSKLQHYWNLTIRLFSVISRTLVGGSYPSAEKQSAYSTGSDDWATPGGSSILHLVSAQSWCRYILADRPTLAHPFVEEPLKKVTYDFVLGSPAVHCMSCSSYVDSFRDGICQLISEDHHFERRYQCRLLLAPGEQIIRHFS